MNKFPKKYNYKNLSRIGELRNSGQSEYSTLLPIDQKIHPGSIFSLFYQDVVLGIDAINGFKTNREIGFCLSSNFYSKLNDPSVNIKHLETKILKQKKNNEKFLDKLKLGCNITSQSFSSKEGFNRYLRSIFVDLYKSEKAFKQEEISYRSKDFQTNISKNNISTKKQELTEYAIKYFIGSKGSAITVVTTDIHTIFADVALVVNPQDKRYKKFIGKSAIIPIINKAIPIIGDEDIDSFTDFGVFRITPGHDQYGLDFAKKHDLPTNIFAVDTNGFFTKHAGEFAGKPVKDFLYNIVKYIDDIGNLKSRGKTTKDKQFNINTGESLDSLMLSQRSIRYSYALDYLSDKISIENFLVTPQDQKDEILSILDQKNIVNISNKSSGGTLIPIIYASKGSIFVIDDKVILDRYQKSNSKKKLTFTLIISNLILDSYLNTSFTIEELIDVLFYTDGSGITKLEKYLQIYAYEGETKREYKRGLKDIQKLVGKIDRDSEKVQMITDLLKDNFAINIEDDNITLNFPSLFAKRDTLDLQKDDSFNKSFIDSVQFLYKRGLSYNDGSYDHVENTGGRLFAGIDQKDFILNTMLLSLEYAKTMIFSGLYLYPRLVYTKGKKITNSNSKFFIDNFGDYLNIYGPDVMRLVLLFVDDTDGEVIFDTNQSQEYDQILNKIRNASRFVHNKYITPSKKIKLTNLIKKINLNITDYDLWVLHDIKAILDDFQYQVGKNKHMEVGKKVLLFCNNILCDKYLEAIKIHDDKNTSDVVLLSFAIVLRMLKPYIPSFVLDIESKLNIDRDNYNLLDFIDITLKNKDYKVNLFMDIVKKIQKLKEKIGSKKHESIDVFIQSNPEFIDFFIDNQELFSVLVNVLDIKYIRLHEQIPDGYETDNVININLGVRSIVDQQEFKKDTLDIIQEEYLSKVKNLQRLKSMITSVIQLGDLDMIAQKKEEISKLKLEIEELDYDISKIKSKI